MTHYQSTVDLTVGCIIVQRDYLAEKPYSNRYNCSSQNGLINEHEILILVSTLKIETNQLIKLYYYHRE